MTANLPHDTWIEAVTPGSCQRQLPDILERALPAFLPSQRWFGDKGETILDVDVTRIATTPLGRAVLALVVVDVTLGSGAVPRYFTPVVVLPDGVAPRPIARIDDIDGSRWIVADAAADPAFQAWLLAAARDGAMHEGVDARFAWVGDAAGSATLASAVDSESRLLSGEQSNSNIACGDRALIKVFRRVQPGINPDVELGRYLAGPAGSSHVPALLAAWELTIGDDDAASIGIAQSLVTNVGDGWSWTGQRLAAAGDDPVACDELITAIRLLGQRTGEIHLALASADDPGLAPLVIGAHDVAGWISRVGHELSRTIARVRALDLAGLDVTTADLVRRFLASASDLASALDGLALTQGLLKTRVHGDYHLGQTLRTRDGDWTLIDFEGEPARTLAERQARVSPLKDVAGMLRSLGYARAFATRVPGAWTDPERRLEAAFVDGYRRALTAAPHVAAFAPVDEATFAAALRPWVVEKALYEIAYEIDNRPDWLWAPISALIGDRAE